MDILLSGLIRGGFREETAPGRLIAFVIVPAGRT
jgi:hypothetical protein